MSSPTREAEKRALRRLDVAREAREFLKAGGRRVCGTCINGHRCPVGGDEERPCWVWQGWEEAR